MSVFNHGLPLVAISPFGSGVGAGMSLNFPSWSYNDVEPTTMLDVLSASDFVLPLVELLLVNFSNLSGDMTWINPVPFSILSFVVYYFSPGERLARRYGMSDREKVDGVD
jgi:hypothetical protein